jgi:hypothetical protein
VSREEEFRISYLTRLAKIFQQNNEVGWLQPDGYINPTELWYHCQFFIDNQYALPAASEFLKPYWETFDGARQEEHHNDGRRWHEYVEKPMTVEAELANEVRRIAYEAGWGRIGSYGNDKIELECLASSIKSLRRHAKEFAALIGRELTIVVVPEPEPAVVSIPSAPRGLTP